MNENESDTPFEDFLRSILGDEAAAEAVRALEAQGFDPANLPAEFSDPARMRAALGQFQFLMDTTAGPVNWRVVEDSAKQAAYASGDPAPTATEAEAARQAMTVADLWLDAATDLLSTCRARCPPRSLSSSARTAWAIPRPSPRGWRRCWGKLKR